MKMATGSGKTTVMAMLIAWHTVNAVRSPNSSLFSRGFLIVTPGITIRDRLRVLLPSDPESYYATRNWCRRTCCPRCDKAKIVITNFHALAPPARSTPTRSAKRSFLQGAMRSRSAEETEGEMLQRACEDCSA